MTLRKKVILPAALALVVGTFGVSMALQSHAQSVTSTDGSTTMSVTPSTGDNHPMHDPHEGGHVGRNGVKEVLLTGDNASKATTAALAAVPGGTVERVETDAEGAVYEAHMVKSDGSYVTVKFDANFNVTNIEQGPNGHSWRHGKH